MNIRKAKDIVISIFNSSSYRKTTETEKKQIIDITKKFGDEFVQSCYVEAATKKKDNKSMTKLSDILKEINVSAFARSIGMNESLLRKYTNGIAKPSDKQLKRIESEINELGNRLKKVKIAL